MEALQHLKGPLQTREGKCAVHIHPFILELIGGRYLRECRYQPGRAFGRRQHLHATVIGSTESSDPPVCPGLAAEPRNCVGSVRAFVHHRIEHTLRVKGAAHVLIVTSDDVKIGAT